MSAYDEVCRNTKSKRKVNRFKEFKCIYISRIYNILKNREYRVGPYVHFVIYEPKRREIVSQGMIDKVVIKKFLKKEKLELNNKSRLYTNNNNFIFLGRNQKGKYARYRSVKRKLKKRVYLYKTGKINLMSLSSSLVCYKNLCSQDIKIPMK